MIRFFAYFDSIIGVVAICTAFAVGWFIDDARDLSRNESIIQANKRLPQGDTPRLEIYGPQGGLTPSPVRSSEAVRREFDYEELLSPEFNRQPPATTVILQFELQKEFARLALASRKGRVKILERLLLHPDAPYEFIVENSWEGHALLAA